MSKVLKSFISSILTLFLMLLLAFFGLIYLPKSVKDQKSNILKTNPEKYSLISVERRESLENFDSFVLDSATKNSKKIIELIYSNPFKLNWYIQKDILKEVEEYNGENLKIWYVYNMGVISKTDDNVICFDLSTVIASPNLLELADLCDYLIISHGDGDHFSLRVVKRVLDSGGKIFLQDQYGILEEAAKAVVPENLKENVYNFESGKEYTIDELEIYSLRTSHRGEERDNAWFSITVNDYNIVHTGDGNLESHKDWEKLSSIDLLLANIIIQPIDLKDSNARYVIPLHMHEVGHNRRFLEEASFSSYLNKLDEYEGSIPSEIYPLLWGESLEISK